MGSSFPDHDEIPIPDRYMPQANASEAEPQEQTMGNDSVETSEIFSGYTELTRWRNSESDVTHGSFQ